MIPRTASSTTTQPSRGLNVGIWTVQVLLALMFVGTGIWKLASAIPDLAAKMPWMGQVSPNVVRATAIVDLLGGLGLVLPSITRIRPGLTVLAALGCIALMVSAIVFHVSRGEGSATTFNVVVIALLLFVAWGRRTKAPSAQRA